ncbi:MAG TPA: potassium transporter Kup [Archangium sp.]|nr:potassium transporter Kup [Archangium sp.]
MHPSPAPTGSEPDSPRRFLLSALGALGVVYGDIGTSPLYALRECFHGPHAIEPSPANVLGVLSLFFWALIIVISVKYLAFVMRADNRGEGGMLALMALVMHRTRTGDAKPNRRVLVWMALFGAGLIYGDGIITPAVSVLSATEGLNVATTAFQPYVVPLTLVILVGLFFLQSHGTAGIGKIFGPVMLLWFVTIATLGVRSILGQADVLRAVWPGYAVEFFLHNGVHGFLLLAVVILVITGGEALYADMGHFGRRPIRLAWFSVALPALLLNYFGQGALLLRDPSADNPFYQLAPPQLLYPLVALATLAASIASQALISGAFSLTRQAIQLGYSPRMEVVHTSAQEEGQIYLPGLSHAMLVGVVVLVLTFRSSSGLAAAYGMATTAAMSITTVLTYVVARERWKMSRVVALPITAVFLAIDLSFLGANAVKVPDGGWIPLSLGLFLFTLMTTWKRGRELLSERLRASALSMEDLLKSFGDHPPTRVPGTAIFMTSNAEAAPSALLHNLKHNKVLHEQTVLLTIQTQDVPHVPASERVEVEPLELGLKRVYARYGFMEDPSIPDVLKRMREAGLQFNLMGTTFFLGRETILVTKKPGMARWREALFMWMSHNARSATSFFRIPPNRVVELGTQVEL